MEFLTMPGNAHGIWAFAKSYVLSTASTASLRSKRTRAT
jgi:hypothetical protein